MVGHVRASQKNRESLEEKRKILLPDGLLKRKWDEDAEKNDAEEDEFIGRGFEFFRGSKCKETYQLWK
jgi:hypothetical protein